MFYETRLNNHHLAYNPFKACVVPRPIGWISSISKNGVINLAPYSYFNAVADIPPLVMFASALKEDGSDKDSLRNIEAMGEFVVNMATYDLCEQVNQTSQDLPYEISEIEKFTIETVPSNLVKPPRVKKSPIHLECEYIKTVTLEVNEEIANSKVIFGHVVGIHIQDDFILEGKVDIKKLKPIGRLGYDEYAVIDNIFKMKRPI